MCIPTGSSNQKGMTKVLGQNLESQYSRSDDAKAANTQYESLSDNYQRWTREDLQRSGELDRINAQVSSAESQFNRERDKRISRLMPKGSAQTGATGTGVNTGTQRSSQRNALTSMMIQNLRSQQFNADKMRNDLIRQASLKRVESGVYNKRNIVASNPTAAVSVIGGASGKASKGSTSGVARGASGSPGSSPTGVKLNIGN